MRLDRSLERLTERIDLNSRIDIAYHLFYVTSAHVLSHHGSGFRVMLCF
jgi:hypothetical protein